jgi:hypothetical protein
MNSTSLDAEFDVWQADGRAVRIDYSRTVMEEVRLAAFDGFHRLAHGGVEIGGVLFGVRDRDAVKILAHRALACEYAIGPSFTLSDNDRRAFEDLLASPNTDSSLSGMQPVGWYHSHTRSEIQLSEKDVQLFQQCFPQNWQIALVLCPRHFDAVRAGFFFREPDGSLHAASTRHEFIIKPVGGKPGAGLPGDRAKADTAPAPAKPAPPEPALLGVGSQSSAPCPQPLAISRDPLSEPEPLPSPVPRAASSYPRRRWARNSAMAAAVSAAAIVVVVTGMLFWIGRSRASAGVSLRARDVGGQLRIDWNRNSSVILQSESGVLEIEDGSLKVHEELSQDHLRAGSITYLRTTGNVLVRLLVRGADQNTFTEISRFLVPSAATAAPPAATAAPPAATAAPIDAGAADRSAKNDGTVAAAVPREPEREVQHVEPVEHPSNRTPSPVRVQGESARQTPAASALARRRLVVPHARVPLPSESLLPAPPVIAANTAAAMPAFIPRLPAPAPPNPADQGPSAGKIIWTGKLDRSGTIQILGNRVSQGHITGGLPGTPVRVQVFPSELTQEGLRIFTADPKAISAPEAPGAQNGWNRTVYVLNPRKAGEIGILEAPGQKNAWNRLILRAERGDHSIIVLRWERVPGESALRAAGNQ